MTGSLIQRRCQGVIEGLVPFYRQQTFNHAARGPYWDGRWANFSVMMR